MSYQYVSDMANSQSLLQRMAGAASAEGEANPLQWVGTHIWELVSATDWIDAWGSAEETKTPNVNPDTGARTDVISDQMILTRVQAVRDRTSTPA